MLGSRPRAYATTNVGLRKNNEDRFRVAADIGLFAVADGMGGYEGGEVASLLAIDTVHSFFRRVRDEDAGIDQVHDRGRSVAESRMELAFRLAHREVCARREGRLSEMGSTLSVLMIRGNLGVVAHVGDSRIYRLREGRLSQLTEDHSLMAAMQAAGVELARCSCYAHVITRAIGVDEDVEADVLTIDVEPGDLFLLCTDGLSDAVDSVHIAKVLKDTPAAAAGPALVDAALEAGSRDNVTAMVVEIPSDRRGPAASRTADRSS